MVALMGRTPRKELLVQMKGECYLIQSMIVGIQQRTLVGSN